MGDLVTCINSTVKFNNFKTVVKAKTNLRGLHTCVHLPGGLLYERGGDTRRIPWILVSFRVFQTELEYFIYFKGIF